MKPTYVFPTVEAAKRFRAMMVAWNSMLIVRRTGRTVRVGHVSQRDGYLLGVSDHCYALGASGALGGEER